MSEKKSTVAVNFVLFVVTLFCIAAIWFVYSEGDSDSKVVASGSATSRPTSRPAAIPSGGWFIVRYFPGLDRTQNVMCWELRGGSVRRERAFLKFKGRSGREYRFAGSFITVKMPSSSTPEDWAKMNLFHVRNVYAYGKDIPCLID